MTVLEAWRKKADKHRIKKGCNKFPKCASCQFYPCQIWMEIMVLPPNNHDSDYCTKKGGIFGK